MGSTWRAEKDRMKEEMHPLIKAAFEAFSNGYAGLSDDDRRIAEESINKLAERIATAVADKVYESVRRCRSKITTFGSQTTQTSFPISTGAAGGLQFGTDHDFDIHNPEN